MNNSIKIMIDELDKIQNQINCNELDVPFLPGHVGIVVSKGKMEVVKIILPHEDGNFYYCEFINEPFWKKLIKKVYVKFPQRIKSIFNLKLYELIHHSVIFRNRLNCKMYLTIDNIENELLHLDFDLKESGIEDTKRNQIKIPGPLPIGREIDEQSHQRLLDTLEKMTNLPPKPGLRPDPFVHVNSEIRNTINRIENLEKQMEEIHNKLTELTKISYFDDWGGPTFG